MMQKIIKNSFGISANLAVTSAFILACLMLFHYFPAYDNFQKVFSGIVFMVILPALYVKIILKKKLRDFGISLGSARQGALWIAYSFVFVALLFYIAIQIPSFKNDFAYVLQLKDNLVLLLAHEIALGFTTALMEFFFRGFVMFYFFNTFQRAPYAIILQTLLLATIWASTEEFGWVFGLNVFLSLFAGLIAHKSHSILYSGLFSWASTVIIELAIIKMLFS